MCQIWTAMIAILLLQYLKNKAKYDWHMSNLVTFIRIHLMSYIDLWTWMNLCSSEKIFGTHVIPAMNKK